MRRIAAPAINLVAMASGLSDRSGRDDARPYEARLEGRR